MTHSDDLGLVLPPKLAPIQVVVVPIYKTEEQLEEIRQVVDKFSSELKAKGISIKFDDDDKTKPPLFSIISLNSSKVVASVV